MENASQSWERALSALTTAKNREIQREVAKAIKVRDSEHRRKNRELKMDLKSARTELAAAIRKRDQALAAAAAAPSAALQEERNVLKAERDELAKQCERLTENQQALRQEASDLADQANLGVAQLSMLESRAVAAERALQELSRKLEAPNASPAN